MTRIIFSTCILLLFSVVLLQSCFFSQCDSEDDGETIKLTDETRKWLPYNGINQLHFEKGEEKSIATILEHTDTIESRFIGDECPPGAQEIVELKIISQLFSDTLEFRLDKISSLNISSEKFRFRYFEGAEMTYQSFDSTKIWLDKVMIDGKIFDQVILIKCISCYGLTEILISKNTGLAAFKFDNEYWTVDH